MSSRMDTEPNVQPGRPLTGIRAGQTVRISRIQPGCRGLGSRLAALGIRVNAEITVVRNGYPGPFVVTVGDCKVALGRGMADRIWVI